MTGQDMLNLRKYDVKEIYIYKQLNSLIKKYHKGDKKRLLPHLASPTKE